MATDEQLTAAQHRAIVALLSAPTVKEAAEAATVGERSLHRWLREDDAFDRAYRKARRQAVQQATSRLQQASSLAVDVLIEVMSDKSAKNSDRVAAARTVLETAYRSIEVDDIEQRLAVLEQGHAQ